MPAQPTIGAIHVRDALDALATLGVDRAALCEAVGVDVATLERPAGRVETATVVRLLDEAERRTGDPFIGVHAGERAEPHGPVDYLIMSTAVPEARLERAGRFSRLILDTLRITVEAAGETASTIFDPGDPVFEASRHAIEYMLMASWRSVRRASGMTARLLAVHFRATDGGRGGELARAFGCPVRFAQPDWRLVHPLRDLLGAPDFDDPQTMERLEKVVAARAAQSMGATTLRDRVATLARALLAVGRRASAQTIARALGLSERSLQRGLQEEGVTFRHVRDGAVREMVEALLADPEHNVEEVAWSVGFTDGAALTKAVKRWTGAPPAAHRRRLADARRSASEEQRRALETPEHGERSHDVGGRERQPRRPAREQANDAPARGRGRRDEAELSELDADVEREERERDLARRQPDLRERAGKTEPVQEPKRSRHHPR